MLYDGRERYDSAVNLRGGGGGGGVLIISERVGVFRSNWQTDDQHQAPSDLPRLACDPPIVWIRSDTPRVQNTAATAVSLSFASFGSDDLQPGGLF